MKKQNHPEITKKINIQKLIDNPVLFGDMCGLLFLFDKESAFYTLSNFLISFVYDKENKICIFNFGGFKGFNCKGGKFYVKRKDLASIFKYCDAVIGHDSKNSFFIEVNE